MNFDEALTQAKEKVLQKEFISNSIAIYAMFV